MQMGSVWGGGAGDLGVGHPVSAQAWESQAVSHLKMHHGVP